MLRSSLAGVGILLAACDAGNPPASSNGGEGWYRPVSVAHEITRESRPDRSQRRGVTWLSSLSAHVSIGNRDRPDEYVLGEVRSGLIDSRGYMIVADALRREVRVYSNAGRYVQTVGGPGSGPGEFRSPSILALDRAERLYVADHSLRLHRFERVGDEYRYLDALRLNQSIQDFCILRDTLFVHGRPPSVPYDRMIHKYTLDGRYTASFGEVYRSRNPDMIENYTRGKIACIEESDRVAYIPSQVPADVRLYDTAGTLLWITTFPTIRELIIEPIDRGYRQTIPESGFDYTQTIMYVPGAGLVVQLGVKTRETRRDEFAALATYLIDIRSGKGAFVTDTLPPFLTSRNGTLVSVRRDPFPHLTLFH